MGQHNIFNREWGYVEPVFSLFTLHVEMSLNHYKIHLYVVKLFIYVINIIVSIAKYENAVYNTVLKLTLLVKELQF